MTLLRILMVILGVVLLAPGLCFVGFGLWFGWGKLVGERDTYGFLQLWPAQLAIGALLIGTATAVFWRLKK